MFDIIIIAVIIIIIAVIIIIIAVIIVTIWKCEDYLRKIKDLFEIKIIDIFSIISILIYSCIKIHANNNISSIKYPIYIYITQQTNL